MKRDPLEVVLVLLPRRIEAELGAAEGRIAGAKV